MINGKDIYDVLSAVVPLYVVMILAYASVRWWRIFTPDQCSGINRLVAVFTVPLLSFHFISNNDIYNMEFRFLAADSLQKLVILAALAAWHNLPFLRCRRGSSSLDWTITLFSLSTLPNTLVMGIPLLSSMYGDFYGSLMVQIVVLQCIVWYTLMLFLYEYRGALALIADQFPADIAASIASFRVDSDVVSLSGRDPLQADAEIGHDGKVHVILRKSATPSLVSSSSYNNNKSLASNITPRASNLTGVEIYSLQSSREPTSRASSFNQSDFYGMFSSKLASPNNPGAATDEDPSTGSFGEHRGAGSRSSDFVSYPVPNPMVSGLASDMNKKDSNPNSNKELHMFVWSSSASPVSEANLQNTVNRAASADFGAVESPKVTYNGLHAAIGNVSPMGKGGAAGKLDIEDGSKSPIGAKFSAPVGLLLVAEKMATDHAAMEAGGSGGDNQQMPPASVMTRLIVIMVWRKLIRNPNTYASLIGLIWSLVSFRWNIEMPKIIKGSISILSDAGLGMAMFSLGLFMALQPKMIACGKPLAMFSMAIRFLAGPAVIAATSAAVGLRGVLLQVAIVQAALPQGIVPFVFAKEYNCHADIISTAVIFGMIVALPIVIIYYILLGL